MTDDRPQSPLSQDPAYWEGLAEKVRADAAGPLAAYAAGEDWTALLARRAPWLVAASAAAMLVLWLALPPRGPSVAFTWIETSLVPGEVAGTLVSGSTPPSVDALMVHFPPPAEEEGRR